MYTVTLHKNIEDLKDAWTSIYLRNTFLSVYQSFEFCSIVAKDFRFSSMRLFLTPLFFEIKKDSNTIMIFPLWRNPNIRKRCASYYLFPDFCLAGYLDPIYDINCTDEDFENALNLLKAHLSAPMYFRRVNEKSLFHKYLQSAYKHRDTAPCVKISFENGYKHFYDSLSKSVRQNIRTSYNRLSRDGMSLSLDVFHSQYLDDNIWDDVLFLHLKRKLLRDGMRENVLRNYINRKHDPLEKALRMHKDNYLFMLRINGKPAAYFSAFLANDNSVLTVPRLSINDDFKFYSPGYLLITEAIQLLESENQITAIDLCHGDQSYKYSLGGKEHLNYYYDIT